MKELMEKLSMQEEPDMESSDLESKMEVLKQLHQMMSDILGNDLDGMGDMEKVEVMAPDQEGLEEGLETAQELMKKKDDLTNSLY